MLGASFHAVHSWRDFPILSPLNTESDSHSTARKLSPNRDTKTPIQRRHPRHPSLHADGIDRYSARPQIKPSGRDCMASLDIDNRLPTRRNFTEVSGDVHTTSLRHLKTLTRAENGDSHTTLGSENVMGTVTCTPGSPSGPKICLSVPTGIMSRMSCAEFFREAVRPWMQFTEGL